MSNDNILSVRPVIPGRLLDLERPRVEALFDKAMETPIVLVIGGAGYGKTHAVYSYLARRDIRTIWIQLSERDNFCDRFWENYTLSMSMISCDSANKLAKQGFPATARQFEQYLSIPMVDIDPSIKYAFVYDDIHLVHDRAVLRFLERSISTPFFNITSILISRRELLLNLTKMHAKGLLGEISETDLRFRREEMDAYFSVQGINASSETLASVYRDTEGWAFAIQLAGLYLKNLSTEGYGIHVLQSNIYRLIESEIMAQISGDLRKFLIKLALISDASPELVRELARLHLRRQGKAASEAEEEKKTGSLLHQIEEIGSLIRFDVYRNVFSMHRLFREYLGEYLDELSKKEKKEVYLAAAGWCACHDLKMDAINYYEKAGDYGSLVTQINMLPLILPGKTVRLLLNLMERIPKGVYSKYTVAYLVHARFLLNEGKLNEARIKIEAIIKTYEALSERKSVCSVLATCYYHLGVISTLLTPISGDYSFLHCFERCHYYQAKWGREIERPKASSVLGAYACRVGSTNPADMERYFSALGAAIPHVSAAVSGCMYGLDDLCRGELEFFRLNLTAAESHLREAMAKARERDQYEIEFRAYFYLMRIGIFLGDVDYILECHRCITGFLEQQQFINRYIYYDIFRSWFYAHIGSCDKVAGWLKKENEDARLNGPIDGLELLVRVKAHMREKNYMAAMYELRKTRSNAGVFVMGKAEVHVLAAVCQYRTGNKSDAYKALEKARLFAEPNGFFMPFAEMGKDIRALATQAARDGAGIPDAFLEKIRNLSSAYAKKFFHVIEYFSAKPDRFSFDRSEGQALSRREQDVLVSLFQGLTQDEIALSISKSVNTVKSVIKRIYEKLGAVNRTDAIRIAMSRGLLEWEGEKQPKPALKNTPPRPLLRKAPEISE
ncbi:MAG: LuxR C-terminal-related transcriptional regulator [Treponema sp.]|jgi:LuxR family maltose regulon positive regulatory protein|nr:LuxR C-terminal-related transcriptional regulator [Treponema sp.]